METKLHGSCDQKLPRFIVQNLKSNTQIFYTIDNPQIHHQRQINELHGRQIRGVYHGWVILTNRRNNALWSLWNPVTSKLILLPPLPVAYKAKLEGSYECCLSSPPDAQGSVFMLLLPLVHTILGCPLDSKRKRSTKWSKTSYAKRLRSIREKKNGYLYSLTCCNGKVYAMTMPSHSFLIQLDIVVQSEDVVISLVPLMELPIIYLDPRPNSSYSIYSFLKGSCMDLFYIEVYLNRINGMVNNVYLYKLDMSSMIWKEMVDFQDAVFFVQIDDFQTRYYSSAVGSELGGYIHIHTGFTSNIIHSFHVKNRTISLSSVPFQIQKSQAYAWAMLEWRLEVDNAECKQEEHAKDTEILARPEVKGGDKTVSDSVTSDQSHLHNMPLDILELIMEHLSVVEYMKFRATCKHCYVASPSIRWSNKTMLSRLKNYPLVSPWLMVLNNSRETITFIDPLFGDRYFIKMPQQLRDDKYRIYCSRYGWLLMYKGKYEKRLVFYNPFTSNIIELPEVNYLECFCFSAPPTSPDCMVVGFASSGSLYVHFVNQGSVWHENDLYFGHAPFSYQFPTFSGQDIYTLCNNGQVEAFRDITVDDFSWDCVVEEGPRSRCKSQEARYILSSCDQHLLLVIIGVRGESVEVFKLNQSTEEWKNIDGLGKHMIYISGTSCICLDAASPEMGNKIYFPRLLHKEDTKIVFYSLETCSYHTFNNKIIQESFGTYFFGTDYHCDPHTWIEPSWC